VSKGADLLTVQDRTLKAIDRIVPRGSFSLAFNDFLYLIGFALLLSGAAILLVNKVKVGSGAGGGSGY
jgi:hypothetical protein